jgi:hypothetical protein
MSVGVGVGMVLLESDEEPQAAADSTKVIERIARFINSPQVRRWRIGPPPTATIGPAEILKSDSGYAP